VSSGSFDVTGRFAGDGSLGDGSTNNLPVGSDRNCGSSEYVAHQGAVSTKGQTGSKDPVHIVRPGAIFKHNVASGTHGEGGANIENKLGVRVSFSIKIDRGISQGNVDGRTMGVDSGSEPLAPHFGKAFPAFQAASPSAAQS
jgi:hypothetical protein